MNIIVYSDSFYRAKKYMRELLMAMSDALPDSEIIIDQSYNCVKYNYYSIYFLSGGKEKVCGREADYFISDSVVSDEMLLHYTHGKKLNDLMDIIDIVRK